MWIHQEMITQSKKKKKKKGYLRITVLSLEMFPACTFITYLSVFLSHSPESRFLDWEEMTGRDLPTYIPV